MNVIRTIMYIGIMLAGWSGSASANVNVINAMTCVPSPETMQQNIYVATSGGIKFKPGRTGKIVLFCPIGAIDKHVSSSARILANFKSLHRDGSIADGNDVIVQLRERSFGVGAVKTLLEVSSDKRTATSAGCGRSCIDTKNNSYYIQVTMFRNSISISQPDDVSGSGGGQEDNVTFSNVTVSIRD